MDDEYVREVLRFFYPDETPPAITDEARELAARLLAETIDASRLMDLVPRPGMPSAGWLLSQGVQIAWRAARRDHRIYETARRGVAWKLRGEYEVLRQVAAE